jgi:O-antigen/teichoic acid export membrane protein
VFGALSAGMGITLITQLLLPPAFLHYYGVSRYGEWLVLSGTLSYLGQLNFGITTYASNELTMLRKRGELSRYKELQGSTLCLLLFMISIGGCILFAVCLLPLVKLLHLSTMSSAEARFAALFLGLQVMVNIFAGYYTSLFMVVEEPHRGFDWFNYRRLGVTLVSVPLAMLRVSFVGMAIGQFVAALLIVLCTIADLKRRMGDLPLGLQGASWKVAKSTLAPSGMFAMIFMQQFMIFQVPLILLQWILGPEVVVRFSISRTILSTARQLLASITNAIAPEITFSFASRDMKKMLSIFHYSEKVVYGVIPVANLGAFLLSPILLKVWLHKPLLFDPFLYGLMALISGAMSMREHKQFFQFSTNEHRRMSMVVFYGNILMIAVSVPFTVRFGLFGFMFIWLISEIAQMGLIYHENKKLFLDDPSINLIPVLKLGLTMAVSLIFCVVFLNFTMQWSLIPAGAAAMAGILSLVVACFYIFGLKDVWDLVRRRMRGGAASSLLRA